MQIHYKNDSYSIINSLDCGVVIFVIPLMFSVQIVADNCTHSQSPSLFLL